MKCDCVVALDITGFVVDYRVHGQEIVYLVRDDETGKVVPIGENTPKLKIEI